MSTCRVCGVELVAGENWSDGQVRARSYRCRPCVAENSRKHYAQHAERAATVRRARLKRPAEAAHDKEYKSAYYAANKEQWAAYRETQKEKERTSAWHRAGRLVTWVRARAAKRGWEFDLTREWAERKLAAGVCEVTGLPLELSKPDQYRLYPWAPSIDRIDCKRGYTQDNCRVVCWIYNMAKAEWCDEDVLKMARALVANTG